MSELYDESADVSGDTGELPPASDTADGVVGSTAEQMRSQQTEADKALVRKLQARIKGDRRHFKKAFDRMNHSMFMAMHGRAMDWSEKNYKANIVGRHINEKTAQVYAKNPKIVARRKETMDFTVWDETAESLMTAMQVAQASAAMPPAAAVDPMTGQAVALPPDPAVVNAQAILADVQQGMQRRQMLKKFGKTLELVFADSLRMQTPLDFKTAMKALVRRTRTTAAGYVELDFQREYGVSPQDGNALNDCRTRLDHLQKLMADAAEGKIDEYHAEMAELQKSIAALEAKDQVCLRSGLSFEFHQSTKIIPDRFCRSLVGFIGAKHLTVELPPMSKADCEERFKCKLGDEYTPYNIQGRREGELRGVDTGDSDFEGVFAVDRNADDMVCVWKHFDKRTGLVYYLCDGHSMFLAPPAPPNVTVPRFWPVYALTFNQVESESELFPPSDVELLHDQQMEVNRSRQGKREHREAARPRFVYTNGTFDPDKDIPELERVRPFEMVGVSGDPQVDIAKKLQAFPVPGVDPNLYDTNEVLQDGMMTVGAQAAQLGGLAKSTATQAAIADGAANTSDASSVDDLDAFLTMIARDGGQILLANLSKDEVVKKVGPGAVWVEDLGVTPEDIYNEVYLEVEAGSSGKPNQPQEIRNFKDLGPIIMQIPGVSPTWFGREAIRRLDDRIDLTEAIVEGLPAMVAMNRASQPMQGGDDPSKQDPNQQGDKGGDKGPPPSDPAGTGPAMGSNQM